jgi:hypothetical protein
MGRNANICVAIETGYACIIRANKEAPSAFVPEENFGWLPLESQTGNVRIKDGQMIGEKVLLSTWPYTCPNRQ